MKNSARIIRTLKHMLYENRIVQLDLISQRGKHNKSQKESKNSFPAQGGIKKMEQDCSLL